MYVEQLPLHERISALDLPTGSYALAGDAALAAYGLLEAGRIDLIVSPAVFRGLPERGWTALPGTDGNVLTCGDVTARTRLHNLSHLSAIDFISDVDQVAGLPVLKVRWLRQSVAASGSSDAVLWRLGLIDQTLGAAASQPGFARPVAQPTRPRSRTTWAYLRGVLTEPGQTFYADRGVGMWGAAYGLTWVTCFISMLFDLGNGWTNPVQLIFGPPIAAGFILLVRRGITGVARRVCGGDPGISSSTASQAAIVATLTAAPVAAIDLLPVPLIWISVLTLVAAAFALFIGFWLIGLLYSAAFDCSLARGVLGEIAGGVVVTLVFLAIGLGLGGLVA